MPRATRNTDLRRSGRGDNIRGDIKGKANLQDQRSKGIYSPGIPSSGSEFRTAVASARPASAGQAMGKGTIRAAAHVGKLAPK